MFQLQRRLQKRVFGVRFWEKVERTAKENFNETNANEFNPRHVQVLLRTYQTGGAAAVLSHTGDPNKGLRDWYENQKHQDNEDVDVEEGESRRRRTGLQRWDSLRDTVTKKAASAQQWSSVRKSILEGDVLKNSKVARVREFKRARRRQVRVSWSSSDLVYVHAVLCTYQTLTIRTFVG